MTNRNFLKPHEQVLWGLSLFQYIYLSVDNKSLPHLYSLHPWHVFSFTSCFVLSLMLKGKGGILEAQCTYTVMCKSEILTSKTEDKYRLAGKGLKEWGKWVFEEESPSQHILRFSRKSFSAITTWLLQNVGLLETSWSSSRILISNVPFKVWQIKC